MSISDGATYAPKSELQPVVAEGDFNFAAAFLDHGHIYGQTNGLLGAGATLTKVYEPNAQKRADFLKMYPQAQPVEHFDELLEDSKLHLIASAAIPDQRAAIGMRVLGAGKDYFTDKSPFTTLEQLERVRELTGRTGRRYFVYYAERVHNEAAWHAGDLIQQGAIGDVIQVMSIAPHRLAAANRPDWFFDKARYGGIITDIGSHQVEQFLTYANCIDATVNFAAVKNVGHPERPGLEDFGEFSLSGVASSEASGSPQRSFYARIDWYTPDGMPVWGDGRTFILGDRGSIEVRKYVDLAREAPASKILLADDNDVREIDCLGRVGFPFFGQLILDVLNGTEVAMTQDHIFKAAELSLLAQAVADES